MRACAAMGLRQAFTSYSNPKGNADTERFLRTLKEELVWLREWTSPGVFFAALELVAYNATYLHSALGYRAPNTVEAEHLGHATPLATACPDGKGRDRLTLARGLTPHLNPRRKRCASRLGQVRGD